MARRWIRACYIPIRMLWMIWNMAVETKTEKRFKIWGQGFIFNTRNSKESYSSWTLFYIKNEDRKKERKIKFIIFFFLVPSENLRTVLFHCWDERCRAIKPRANKQEKKKGQRRKPMCQNVKSLRLEHKQADYWNDPSAQRVHISMCPGI